MGNTSPNDLASTLRLGEFAGPRYGSQYVYPPRIVPVRSEHSLPDSDLLSHKFSTETFDGRASIRGSSGNSSDRTVVQRIR
jgi:hypothetical protein